VPDLHGQHPTAYCDQRVLAEADDEDMDTEKTTGQRIEAATPSQLRRMTREGIPSDTPDDQAAQGAGPGPSDGGGASIAAPAGVSLQTEMDPKRVREAARKLREQRR
jgi:hypothetical protein